MYEELAESCVLEFPHHGCGGVRHPGMETSSVGVLAATGSQLGFNTCSDHDRRSSGRDGVPLGSEGEAALALCLTRLLV